MKRKIVSVILTLFMLMPLASHFAGFAAVAPTITVPSVSDTAGSTVSVAITIENNPGILGAALEFTFDAGLELVNAACGDAFSALTMTKPGKLTSPCKFVWDGQELNEDDTQDGTVVVLQFKIPEDAETGTKYSITASYEAGDFVNAYLKPISPGIVNGWIEVLDYVYGDLDENKKINTSDVILLRRHIAGGYEQTVNEKAADVNNDNKKNSTDVILMRRYIAGGYGVTFPYTEEKCNHVMKEISYKAPTYTAVGNITYWECEACGMYYGDKDGTTEIMLGETVIPVLVKDEYTIQYACDMVPFEGNTPVYIPDDVYSPSKRKVLPIPKMDTYKFLGWSDENGRMYGTELPEGTTGDLVLYANWASDRNKAVPVEKIGDPIICEDSENGQILFVYEIGEIHNIPIFETQDLLVVNGLITSTGVVKQTSIKKENAEEIGKTIANTTTNSATWSFSKDWNEIVSVSEEWAEENGMSMEEAEAFSKNTSNTYNTVNSSSGSLGIIEDESSSYRKSQNKGHVQNTYDEDIKYTNFNVDGKFSTSTTVSAGMKFPLTIGSAELGASNTTAFEIGAGYNEQNYTKDIQSGTTSWEENIDESATKATTLSAEKTWNTMQGFSASNSTSASSEISKAVSKLISQKYSEDTTYTTGGSEGETQEQSSSNAQEDLYSASVTYSEAEMEISERKFESNGHTYGAYRLVQVGMAHVFAVVGYDIKNKSYYTYTHSILDDDVYKEYLDYSYDRTFRDYETTTLSFEIPVFVNDYVNSRIASSKLQVNDNGVVMKYLGNADDEVILIPSYYTRINATTKEAEMIKIRGIAPGLFKGNTSIIGVTLGNFINEIPASAFEGCTALKEVVCPNVVRIGDNAFKGCVSLSTFSLPNEIESVGENAFDGIQGLSSRAPTKEIAEIVANSNARNITLDISGIVAEDFSDLPLNIGEIETFKLLGAHKEYKGLTVDSDARETIISGITVFDCTGVPLELSSPNVTLERVTVHSDGFALALKAEETTLSVEGVSSMQTDGSESIIGKNINLVQLHDEAYSAIETNGSVLVCGSVTNNDGYIETEKIVTITEDEYINYLTQRKVTFDANGGTASKAYKMVPYNNPMGDPASATRDYYTFDGWYTEAEGGERVTAETVIVEDVTLFAHWVQNDVSAWTKATEVPEDVEIVDKKYTYNLTSETTSGSSSLSGWTQYKSTWVWGGWSGWLDYNPGSNSNREITTQQVVTGYNQKKQWFYSRYYKWNGSYYIAWGIKGNCNIYEDTGWLDYSLPHEDTHDCGKAYGRGWVNGRDVYWYNEQTRWVANYDSPINKTQWKYRDKIFTYYFRKVETLESATLPEGSNISNVQEWVQYRNK